jgi:hypothetical protein
VLQISQVVSGVEYVVQPYVITDNFKTSLVTKKVGADDFHVEMSNSNSENEENMVADILDHRQEIICVLEFITKTIPDAVKDESGIKTNNNE